ncbi:flocculation protein FLO11 [Rosa rugosa]|uniref:flocculation protein FLO11 n=1 Tax=Rosa rugosa TaxID=74645 RepID=UPI002B40C53F|nr:flocculation protein FLO11 [Rosa rugosa]
MKGTSKVIMGATLVMVVSLAIVLGLILVLLAELYCSLLLRRRRQHKTDRNNSIVNTDLSTTAASATEAATTTTSAEPSLQPQGPPLGSFLGVLRAPRSFLFPSCKEEYNAEPKKQQHCHLHHVLDIPNQEISNESPSISLANSPQPAQRDPVQAGTTPNTAAAAGEDHLVYISNPIYDNEANRASSSTTTEANTPFETPDTSPSRLEMGGSTSSSGEDNDEVAQPTPSGSGPSSPTTPPLTPMKKLPKEACSVSLRDARSLGTSGSDSNTNNGNSSSSSGSPCTSPSW